VWPRPAAVFTGPAPWTHYVARSDSPTIRARVAGREVLALIDTGAQYSAIDQSLYDAIGRPSGFEVPLVAYGVGGGPQVGRGVRLDIELPGVRLAGVRTAILSLGPLAAAEGAGITLILGRDVLSTLVLDIDGADRRVRLHEPGALAVPTELAAIATRNGAGGMMASVTVEGAEIEAMVDTGASGLLSLSRSAANRAGLLDGRERRAGSTIVLGGALPVERVEARTVTVGDRLHRRAEVGVFPDVAAPGVPEALLGSRVIIDLARNRLHVGEPVMTVTAVPRRRRT
jgi:predicted aspartyl protease